MLGDLKIVLLDYEACLAVYKVTLFNDSSYIIPHSIFLMMSASESIQIIYRLIAIIVEMLSGHKSNVV